MASSETEKNYPLHKNYCCKLFPFFCYYSDFNIAHGFNYPLQDIFVKL